MKSGRILLAGLIGCALCLGSWVIASAPPAADAAKKCPAGKVRKKGKCVKKRSSGPTVPAGTYACNLSPGGWGAYGILRIVPGNKYRINDGKTGRYSFSKKHKIVSFKTGDYVGFFGVYSKNTIEIRAAESDEYVTKGDWLWSCLK